MKTIEEKKTRLNKLMEGTPRGTQQRLARYCGVSSQQVWNWRTHKTRWTSADHEQKIWQFFEQDSEAQEEKTKGVSATMGIQVEAKKSVSASAPIQVDDVQNARHIENIEAVTGLFSLLEHDNAQVRQHIVNQIKLLTEAQFPQTKEYKDLALRRGETIKQVKKMLTEEAVKTLLEEGIIPLLLADSTPHEEEEEEEEG